MTIKKGKKNRMVRQIWRREEKRGVRRRENEQASENEQETMRGSDREGENGKKMKRNKSMNLFCGCHRVMKAIY